MAFYLFSGKPEWQRCQNNVVDVLKKTLGIMVFEGKSQCRMSMSHSVWNFFEIFFFWQPCTLSWTSVTKPSKGFKASSTPTPSRSD